MQKLKSPIRRLNRLAWSLTSLLQKQRIALEDRFHLFPYSDWIEDVERAAIETVLEQSKHYSADLPVVSFMVSCMQASAEELLATLESLRQQPGDSWLLVLLLPKTSSLLKDKDLLHLVDADPQVSWLVMEPPIERNAWLDVTDQLPGDWVVPLEPGDRVSPVWMNLFLFFLHQNESADIFFWDEDVICQNGDRVNPFFKPGWSQEYLFSRNYLATAAFRKQLIFQVLAVLSSQRAGWIFEAAQAACKVVHIPFVLLSRSRGYSRSQQESLDFHASDVRTHLERCGYKDVAVEFTEEAALRVRWQVAFPLVSIIIPTKNNLTYLRRCISSLIEKTDYPSYEILLMDDNSTDAAVIAYYQELRVRHPEITIYQNEGEFNYSRVNNRGASLAKGQLFLFLNNDVEILSASWLKEMVRWVLQPGVGMVGARLLYPDGSIQHAGIVLGMTGHASHVFARKPLPRNNIFVQPDEYRNVSAVTGACMLVRREAFEGTGGFDEGLRLVFNDVDLGMRFLRGGWRIVYTPAAELIHYEGRSRARFIPQEDIRLGAERLQANIEQGDTCYNPNLSLAVNWPSLRRPYETNALYRLWGIVRYKGPPEGTVR